MYLMQRTIIKWLALTSLAATGAPALALDVMSDGDMSGITAQDGVTISVTEPASGINLNMFSWITANYKLANELGLDFATINMKRLDTSRPFAIATADVGYNGTNPKLALSLDWARSRLDIGSIGITNVSGSFGRYVIDAGGRFDLQNTRGIADMSSTNSNWSALTKLNVGGVDEAAWAPGTLGAATPGQVYWHQGTSELSMGDFVFYFSMPTGRIGIDSNGLRVQSKTGTNIGFALSLDFMYDANSTSSYAINSTDDLSLLYWGWRGHQTDFDLRAVAGGRVDGGGKGLKASLAFNYTSDFVWIIGEGGGSPLKLEFGNWTLLPGNTLAYNLPSVTLDQLEVGQGTTGLCWGLPAITATANGSCSSAGGLGQGAVASNFPVQPIKVRQAADPRAMALSVRDMTLAAYSSKVDIIDRTVNPTKAAQTYNWALIYTFADLDADIIISPASTNDRMRLDLSLTTQTLGTTESDRWQHGTNFMIGDTDPGINFGIGLVGSDVLMATRNGTLGLTAGGIKFDTRALRYQLRGLIAGGQLPNMTVMQKMAYVDANLEADRFVLTIAPSATGHYLAYSGFINIINSSLTDFSNPLPSTGNHAHGSTLGDDGSYLSLAEPDLSKLGVDFRFANITGSVEVTNGRLDLMGDSDSTLKLLLSHNVRVGTSATVPCDFGVASCTAVAGAPLQVGRLEFGGKNLGTIIMPSGIVRTAVSLMPNVP